MMNQHGGLAALFDKQPVHVFAIDEVIEIGVGGIGAIGAFDDDLIDVALGHQAVKIVFHLDTFLPRRAPQAPRRCLFGTPQSLCAAVARHDCLDKRDKCLFVQCFALAHMDCPGGLIAMPLIDDSFRIRRDGS